MTGRAALEGTWDDEKSDAAVSFERASGMMSALPQSEEEMEAIRTAVVTREGLLVSVFDVLRRVPRRVLMVLKLNDLTRWVLLHYQPTVMNPLYRSLDHALATTHSNIVS